MFELGRTGFQFFATCHAETVEEIVYSLSSYPLRISVRDLSSIDVLIFLRAWREGRTVHREIERVVALRGDDAIGLEAILLFLNGETRIDGVARAFGFDADATDAFEIDREARIAELWDRCRR